MDVSVLWSLSGLCTFLYVFYTSLKTESTTEGQWDKRVTDLDKVRNGGFIWAEDKKEP